MRQSEIFFGHGTAVNIWSEFDKMHEGVGSIQNASNLNEYTIC